MANHKRFTEDHEVELFEDTIKLVTNGALSYRAGAQRMRDLTGKKFSHEAMRKECNKRKANEQSEAGLGDQPRAIPN